MGRTRRVPAVMAAVAVLLTACGGDGGGDRGADDGAVTVVAGFYPLAEAAERAGGDDVDVTNLTPAGAEAHDLELQPDQVDDLEDADVVVVLGRGFQPGVEEVAGRRDGPTVEVLDAIGVEGDDPHVWLDPSLMIRIVEEVGEALADADPDGADRYEANAAAYVAELEALDRRYEEGLAGCERPTLVTAHEAFAYLADRYGLEHEAIAGISPEQEPDPRRLAELARLVEDEGVTTIFTETLVDPAVAATLAREAGVATAVLDPVEGLDDDRLEAGESYVSVMDANLEVLREGLGCGS